MVSQAGRCIDDRGAGTGTLAARPVSCLCLRAADVRPVIRAEDPSRGSELRIRAEDAGAGTALLVAPLPPPRRRCSRSISVRGQGPAAVR